MLPSMHKALGSISNAVYNQEAINFKNEKMKLNITKLDLIVSEGYQNENSMRKKDNKSEK